MWLASPRKATAPTPIDGNAAGRTAISASLKKGPPSPFSRVTVGASSLAIVDCHRASTGSDGAALAPSQRSVSPGRRGGSRRLDSSGSAPPPRLRGPLGPWWGTDDFLGLERARGRVSTPQGSSPIALIQKGDWCGSERICTRSTRTAGALTVTTRHFLTNASACLGARKSVVPLIGVS